MIALLYFLITFAIMAVSILLIYRAACFFGLQVDRWALILCAVMAVGVNFASIYLSNILTLDHLMVVITLVLVSAALVTLFNEYLLRRHAPALAGVEGTLAEEALFGEDEAGAAEGASAPLAAALAQTPRLSGGGKDSARRSEGKKSRRRKRKISSDGAVTEVVVGAHAAADGFAFGSHDAPPAASGQGEAKTPAATPPSATGEAEKAPPPAPFAKAAPVGGGSMKAAAPSTPAAPPAEVPSAEAGKRPGERAVRPADRGGEARRQGEGPLPEASSAARAASAFVEPLARRDAVLTAGASSDLAPAIEGAKSGATAGQKDAPSAAPLRRTAAPPVAIDGFRSVRPAGKPRGPKGQYGAKRRFAAKEPPGGRGKATARWTPPGSGSAKGWRSASRKAPPIGLELARLRTLDDYLNYAGKKRAEGCVSAAILTYQQALGKFRDDSYLPFIVIELGNLYKDAGDYAEAASAYRSALRLSAVKRQPGMVAAFRENIAYLEAISRVLTRRRMANTPFSQIPPDCRSEIESVFAARRPEKYQRTGGKSK